MVKVYSEYYTRKYYSNILSCGTFCCSVSFIMIIVLPFLLAFSVNKFWAKPKIYYEQPFIQFNGAFYIQVVKTDGTSLLYSTINRFNLMAPNQLLSPTIETEEADIEDDGLNELLVLRLTLPLTPLTVRQINLIAGLDYTLFQNAKLFFSAGIYASYCSAFGISSVEANGRIILKQKNPLTITSIQNIVNASNDLFTAIESKSYFDVVDEYSRNNQSLYYDNKYMISPYGINNEVKVRMSMIVHNQEINYAPQMLEILKGAWVYYMGFLIPIYIIIYYGILWVAFRYGVFASAVTEDRTINKICKNRNF